MIEKCVPFTSLMLSKTPRADASGTMLSCSPQKAWMGSRHEMPESWRIDLGRGRSADLLEARNPAKQVEFHPLGRILPCDELVPRHDFLVALQQLEHRLPTPGGAPESVHEENQIFLSAGWSHGC